jgi:hypothetical protein
LSDYPFSQVLAGSYGVTAESAERKVKMKSENLKELIREAGAQFMTSAAADFDKGSWTFTTNPNVMRVSGGQYAIIDRRSWEQFVARVDIEIRMAKGELVRDENGIAQAASHTP